MQKILFFLLIILLPVQLGRHFWPEFAFVSGARVDYLSPTLYLTDLLVIGIFLLEIFKGFTRISGGFALSLVLVGVFAGANIYFSLSPAVSTYKWLKVLELGFLGWWIAKRTTRLLDFRTTAILLLIPIFYESVLVFWQFGFQQSLGLWVLGERTFNPSTPGIANTVINSQLWLRPYGSFPHPNVLGGWLAVVLPLVIYYFPHNYRRIAATILGLGLAALFLTMSRAAIVVGLVAMGVVLAKRRGLRLMWLVGLIGVIFIFGVFRSEGESVVVREQLNRVAVQNFFKSPVFGTGLGTAVFYQKRDPSTALGIKQNYALVHQPTHNIYLLVLGELGVLAAMGAVGLWVLIIIRSRRSFWAVPLLSIGALAMFDHYFLTLQQTQLLFAIVLGFGLKLESEI